MAWADIRQFQNQDIYDGKEVAMRVNTFAIGVLLGLLLILAACGASGPAPVTNGAVIAPTAEATPAAASEPAEDATDAAEADGQPADSVPGAAENAAEDVAAGALVGEQLRVAVNAQFPPFVTRDEDGTLTGFDIELMQALAFVGGFDLAFTDLPFEELLPSVARGEYDAAISAISVTDARMRVVDFTDPYFETSQAVVSFLGAGQGLAVRVDETEIFSVDDLSPSTRVGVKEETTGDEYATEELDVDVIRYPEVQHLLAALQNEDVDAIITDVAVIARSIDEESGIRLSQTGLTEEAYAIAVNKDREEVLVVLNEGLAWLRADGTYEALFNLYFGIP